MSQTEDDFRFQIRYQWEKYDTLDHLDDYHKDYMRANFPQMWNAYMNYKNSQDLLRHYIDLASQGDLL